MGSQSAVETRFREHIRGARERQGWSQADLSKCLQAKGLAHILASTVAKIEAGDRAVRIDEADALADVFGLSLDALLGRNRNEGGSKLVLAAAQLQSVARRAATDVDRLDEALDNEVPSVRYHAEQADAVGASQDLIQSAENARAALKAAFEALTAVAQMPVPAFATVTRTRKASR